MKRQIYKDLLHWKERSDRKPLILLGARQVGKTFILKDFGQREFRQMVYVNCHKNSFVQKLFNDMSVERIITDIERFYEVSITDGDTLLFLDEIQEVADGVASLKYFCENRPGLHVAVAGSLLGITLREGESYPVGKVQTLRMYPMTFGEYLNACGRKQLNEMLNSLDWKGMTTMHETLIEYLRQYYLTGGMPEAVAKYVETHDVYAVREVQNEIVDAYERDVAKHTKGQSIRIHQVWQSIVPQLARENKKFIFGAVRKGARAADFETAIQWLVDAGLVNRVAQVREPSLPLKYYADSTAFKLFLHDCGLLACIADTNPNAMLLGNNAFVEFKGAFTENYVLQQMRATLDNDIFYYSKENSTLEIDFLAQIGDKATPIEVKAEVNVKSKSLSQFVNNQFSDHHLHGIRFSMLPYKDQDWMTNIPLYAVEAYMRNNRQR